MRPGNTALVVFALLLLPAFGPRLAAQAVKPPQPPAAQAPAPTPGEIQAWFDAMAIVQAQRALGLSDPQYPQFVGRLKALQDTRRRNQRQRMQLIQDINRLLAAYGGPADAAVLRDKMKELDDQQDKATAEIRKAYENLDQVLDVRQQARFRVFEEQIERRKFEILLNARRGRGAAPQRDR